MRKAVYLFAWWYLIQVTTLTNTNVEARGPYPSRSFCLKAQNIGGLSETHLTGLDKRARGIENYDYQSSDLYEEAWFFIRLLFNALVKVITIVCSFIATAFCAAAGLFIIENKIPSESNSEAARRLRTGLCLIGVGHLFALSTLYFAGFFS